MWGGTYVAEGCVGICCPPPPPPHTHTHTHVYKLHGGILENHAHKYKGGTDVRASMVCITGDTE